MKRTFFLFSALLAALFAPGCGQLATDSARDEQEFTDEDSGITLRVEASFEIPTGRKVCQQAKEAVRDCIYQMFLDDGQEHISMDPRDILVDCMTSSQNWFYAQQEWIGEEFVDVAEQFALEYTGEVRSIYKDILCYFTYYSEYTGGARPMDWYDYLNVDIKTGETVTLDTLLKEGYEEPLSQLIAQNLKNSLEQEEYDTVDPDPGLSESYRIDSEGISFSYFSIYLFPGYLRGMEVTVPWNELKDLMK